MVTEEDELFKNAAKEAIQSSIPKKPVAISKEEELVLAAEIIEEGKTDWDRLVKAVDGPLAKRFLDELQALSGREFMRNYLKFLEFAKPKMMRQEIGMAKEEEDNKLTIEVKSSSHKFLDKHAEDIKPEEDD